MQQSDQQLPASGNGRQTPVLALCIEELSVGGAEQVVVLLANEFARRGWSVHVICLRAAGALAPKLMPAVKVHVLHKRPGIDLLLPFKLLRCVSSIKPDVINTHLWVANTWTRLSLLLRSIPVVVTEHSSDHWKPKYYRRIDRWLLRRSYRLIAVSADVASFYQELAGKQSHRVMVIGNGIDTRCFSNADGASLRQRWLGELMIKDNRHSVLVGSVGRLVDAKNYQRLLHSFAMLRDDKQLDQFNLALVIVGDGPERDALQKTIHGLGLQDAVLMPGERHDIPEVLSALDIFVLSSDREGHPLTALEAQATGTPVVLTDAGGAADTIARQDHTLADAEDDMTQCGGVLVDRQAEAITQGIKPMILDSNLRQRRAVFARRFALNHFDHQHMADAYASLFSSAIRSDSRFR